MCINLSPALQGGGWAEGGERRVGVGGREGGGKTPQVMTRGWVGGRRGGAGRGGGGVGREEEKPPR